MNEIPEMPPADSQRFSNRRWSLVLFLAVLVGIAQFGLGQFSAWVLAAPFVALLFMEMESTWKAGSGSQTLASSMASGGVLSQAAAALVFHGVVIGAVMTAASGVGDLRPNRADPFVSARPASGGGCGSGSMCGGGPVTAALAKAASSGGCGSGGCGSSAGGSAGGCGSGGCGAGGAAASSATGAKSACGCGSGSKSSGTVASTTTGVQAVPLPGSVPALPNANAMRPSLPPPMMPRPNGTVPGVSNQPVAISPQAMAVISAQQQVTLPRPAQGPTMPPSVPTTAGKPAEASLPPPATQTGATVPVAPVKP